MFLGWAHSVALEEIEPDIQMQDEGKEDRYPILNADAFQDWLNQLLS